MEKTETNTTFLDEPGSAVAPLPTHTVAARSPLADLRDNALSVPAEQMQGALAEYADRRVAFYRWLLEQMTEGVHYGVPPGCEPRRGVDPRQWKAKPSLYKAGADFVCDLMGLRDEYDSDMVTWEMLGKPSDTFIRRCRLFSRSNGTLVGQGTGARKNGAKSMDANGSLKMADKTAKVAAIINSYGLSDLFSQDFEDLAKQQYEAPAQRADAPTTKTRGERQEPVTQDELASLLTEWKTWQQGSPSRDDFAAWARSVCGDDWNPSKLGQWNLTKLAACWAASNKVTGAPE